MPTDIVDITQGIVETMNGNPHSAIHRDEMKPQYLSGTTIKIAASIKSYGQSLVSNKLFSSSSQLNIIGRVDGYDTVFKWQYKSEIYKSISFDDMNMNL